MLTIGSLFSGIGGLDYGFERTNEFRTVWFCETDKYANTILKKHWPEVPNYGDVTKIDWSKVQLPDVLVGGFPCQDISVAGKGAGIKEGTRSGLWKEYLKAIRILRPKYAVIENVPMLAKRGLNIVLADLASIGYDAEWNIIPASTVGAIHKRERIFIITYPNSQRCNDGEHNRERGSVHDNKEWDTKEAFKEWEELQPQLSSTVETSNLDCIGSKRVFKKEKLRKFGEFSCWEGLGCVKDIFDRPDLPKPLIRREDDGIPNRIHRIKCLGNAVVPQVAQVIAEMILEYEKSLVNNSTSKKLG